MTSEQHCYASHAVDKRPETDCDMHDNHKLSYLSVHSERQNLSVCALGSHTEYNARVTATSFWGQMIPVGYLQLVDRGQELLATLVFSSQSIADPQR